MVRPEFIFKPEGKMESVPVGHIVGRFGTEGEVGIEVEVEGNKFPKAEPPFGTKVAPLSWSKYWAYTKDGSLRGKDNAEYILRNPIRFAEVSAAVTELSDKLKSYGTILDDSNRTSVHIHVNCQEFHLNRLASFAALWYTFEDILSTYCGDHRAGNLFCLRAKDAPGVLEKVKKFIQQEETPYISNDGLHYAALNFQSLLKFGSLEIRTMRGPTDLSLITTWAGIIERLYLMSAVHQDPRTLLDVFSQYGPEYFFNYVLGEFAPTVLAVVPEYDIRTSLYEGIRFAQEICYCRDWDIFNPVAVDLDPFGRVKKKKKSATGLVAAYGSVVNSVGDFIPPLEPSDTFESLSDNSDDFNAPDYDDEE